MLNTGFGVRRGYYHDMFYIINEEIVIGSILLFALVNKRKVRPIFCIHRISRFLFIDTFHILQMDF
ncbi:hypothetical protein DSECCO2_448560 [anaerobic digester metagenome]